MGVRFLIAPVLVLLFSPFVEATTFLDIDDESITEQADVIVRGTIQNVRPKRIDNQVVTFSKLRVQEVWKGSHLVTNKSHIIIRENGGIADGLSQIVFGAPVFKSDQEVILYLQTTTGGYFQTLHMQMGALEVNGSKATRMMGPNAKVVRAKKSVGILSAVSTKGKSVGYLKQLATRSVGRVSQTNFSAASELPANTDLMSLEDKGFNLMNPPSRWFQIDEGKPIILKYDPRGDKTLGLEGTKRALDEARRAWSTVYNSGLKINHGGALKEDERGFICGPTGISFNDPRKQINDPVNCGGGALAVGGFCATAESKGIVGGEEFRNITSAAVVFNNGWNRCWFWNETNVAEIATHEIGHAIGFAHSAEGADKNPTEKEVDATMYWAAHFDGRGGSLKALDKEGARFVYPLSRVKICNQKPKFTFKLKKRKGTAGSARRYQVTVQSRECKKTSYKMIYTLPEGWSVEQGPKTLKLSPQQKKSFTVKVRSHKKTTPGTYKVKIKAKGKSANTKSGSGVAKYIIKK